MDDHMTDAFNTESNSGSPLQPAWQPLPTIERRIFGVLVEKAKTTPDAYPLTINAITTGANQKSNRSPLMSLEPIDVENALDYLRKLGAVSEVQGGGRMPKYRHRVYEWLGVNKVEAAVMTELLLRGEQTLGELRARAARMEPINDVASLKPILADLQKRGLIQALTPQGRGQIVTHCLYTADQQVKLLRKHGSGDEKFQLESDTTSAAGVHAAPPFSQTPTNDEPTDDKRICQLETELQSLRGSVAEIERRLTAIEQLIQ
ncbi:YceH family protein [Pirellulaceae bacterium]|jgi:uncharacterized protein|nr:YceH family protein [Pirellulaceae bacterium]